MKDHLERTTTTKNGTPLRLFQSRCVYETCLRVVTSGSAVKEWKPTCYEIQGTWEIAAFSQYQQEDKDGNWVIEDELDLDGQWCLHDESRRVVPNDRVLLGILRLSGYASEIC